MTRIRMRRVLLSVIIAGGLLGGLYAFASRKGYDSKGFIPGAVAQQRRGKLITREKPRANDPVVIRDVKLRGRPAQLNEEFDGTDDWLKDVSFRIQNTSHKNITYLVVEASFPDSQATGNLMAHDIRFGRRPDAMNQTREPLLLRPGESLDIDLGPRYANIKGFLETRQPVSAMKTLSLRPYVVFFEDGTQWSAGSYFRPDPSTRGRFIKIPDPPNASAPR